MVGKGQPPKAPEDKRTEQKVWLSEKEREAIEEARKIEAPEKRFGAYLRDSAVEHAQEIIDKNKK